MILDFATPHSVKSPPGIPPGTHDKISGTCHTATNSTGYDLGMIDSLSAEPSTPTTRLHPAGGNATAVRPPGPPEPPRVR